MIKEIFRPVKMAFYGTLRMGFAFHEELRYDLKFIEKQELTGYAMYDLGAYPAVICTYEAKDRVHTELYEILTKQTFMCIDGVEKAAGYYLDWITIDGESFGIYLFKEIKFGTLKVNNGDWKAYTDKAKFNC